MPKPRKKKKMHMQWSCFFEIFTPIPLQPAGGTSERVADNAWAQKQDEGCRDTTQGPRIDSTGAVHAPRPQPPPYPTVSCGLIIQHLLPGGEVGIAPRAEVG